MSQQDTSEEETIIDSICPYYSKFLMIDDEISKAVRIGESLVLIFSNSLSFFAPFISDRQGGAIKRHTFTNSTRITHVGLINVSMDILQNSFEGSPYATPGISQALLIFDDDSYFTLLSLNFSVSFHKDKIDGISQIQHLCVSTKPNNFLIISSSQALICGVNSHGYYILNSIILPETPLNCLTFDKSYIIQTASALYIIEDTEVTLFKKIPFLTKAFVSDQQILIICNKSPNSYRIELLSNSSGFFGQNLITNQTDFSHNYFISLVKDNNILVQNMVNKKERIILKLTKKTDVTPKYLFSSIDSLGENIIIILIYSSQIHILTIPRSILISEES